MWTTYPPRYHDRAYDPTPAQWCAAWQVPVVDGIASLWIKTAGGFTVGYDRQPAGPGDTLPAPQEDPDRPPHQVNCWASNPWDYYGDKSPYGSLVWRNIAVPVDALVPLRPLGTTIQCARIYSGAAASVGGIVEAPTPGPAALVTIDPFARVYPRRRAA